MGESELESNGEEPRLPGARPRRWLRRGVIAAVSLLVVTAAVTTFVISHMPTGGGVAGASAPELPVAPLPLQVIDTTPASGGSLSVTSDTISVEFSAPLAADTPFPTLSPSVPGTWSLSGPSTLVFQATHGFVPLSTVMLTAPAGSSGPRGSLGESLPSIFTASFNVTAPSVLRLQQLLAELGYLPVSFVPSTPETPPAASGADTSTLGGAGVVANSTYPSMVDEAGTFSWRFEHVPASLKSLWQPGVDTTLVQGAVMAFQSAHGLEDDGVPDATFWGDVVNDVMSGQVSTAPYDYLQVSMTLPETLTVWQNGKVIYQTRANTGIPEAPTASGTYPVYARYLSTTMSGLNPDGSHYDDPGVPYVAYFNGGDAVHGFLRSSYGFPQSLGCVELSYSSAAVVYNDDPIGTLVTVSPT